MLIKRVVLAPVTSAWRWYRSKLQAHPWKTQLLTTGILMGGGDALAQTVIEQRSRYSYRHGDTARFTFLGVVYVAPVVQTWYIFLQRYVTGHPLMVPLKMIVYDQLLFSPFSLAIFLILLRGLEGRCWEENVQYLRRDWWTIYTTGLEIWPFVQVVKFYLVPLNYRLIAAQCFALIWNTFIAHRARINNKRS